MAGEHGHHHHHDACGHAHGHGHAHAVPPAAMTGGDHHCGNPGFDQGNPLAERNTRRAVLLTAVMMVAEIAGGWYYGSMALLADGWHMGTHALALGISVLAYHFARRFAGDARFAFGTWKIEILGGYTSALMLAVVAAAMVVESVARLIAPTSIHYDQAIAIALVGLAVNLLCAWWLHGSDSHDHHDHHGHSHSHDHGHSHGEDLNLRAAYVHVVTDAATSVLAIVALLAGKFWGADWLDPVMGIAGGVLVAIWAVGLLRDTGRVLLDAEMDDPVVERIRQTVQQHSGDAAIVDLHAWRIGRGAYACIVSVESKASLSTDALRAALLALPEVVHATVEVRAGAWRPVAAGGPGGAHRSVQGSIRANR
ncbi:CDF family Co(II)/Ni(II) efflux transporter DmeF [Uliginosibacterium sp. H1]|uniref:CDF family Co(II)/Ni(II) efflux transporter DmeF n=1 Tax=Uliginosibacterium sp. H1 TaxID=3114757 RepID=UPI002E1811ED|nr:CDF family Co(II)/Ni(II) efflux transporter DmeF [Uliginosibacterium sp. H1]